MRTLFKVKFIDKKYFLSMLQVFKKILVFFSLTAETTNKEATKMRIYLIYLNSMFSRFKTLRPLPQRLNQACAAVFAVECGAESKRIKQIRFRLIPIH